MIESASDYLRMLLVDIRSVAAGVGAGFISREVSKDKLTTIYRLCTVGKLTPCHNTCGNPVDLPIHSL
jgi:hypothetical protein